MAFRPGFVSRLNVGAHAWSAYTAGFNMAANRPGLDVTVLTDEGKKKFIVGQNDAAVGIDMILDTAYAASSQFATMNTWATTSQVVTLAPSGLTRGNECWLIDAYESNATVATAVADKVTATLTLVPTGAIGFGVILDDWTAITADTDGTSTDNGAASSNGGIAHLHVSAYTGLTSDSVIIEHSSDNAAWATLGTFASVTAIGAERLIIAAGTTVNRYLRVRDDVTGTGSVTRQVSFARS